MPLRNVRLAGQAARAAAFSGLLATLTSLAGGQTAAVPRYAATSIEDLGSDIAVYRQHVLTLANPYFEGRAPGTKGNRLAADYLEFEFRRLGLQPAFPAGSAETLTEEEVRKEAAPSTERVNFRQPFIAPASLRPGDSTRVIEQAATYSPRGGASVVLKAGEEYNLLGYTGSGTATGAVAFVGYAISSETREYDSFALDADGKPVDLAGRIAIVLRFEPMNEAGKSKWAGEGWSPAAALETKLRAVEKKGAAGIILVNPPGADDDRTGKLEDLSLSGGRSVGIPVAMLSIPAADALVKAADAQGRSLLDLRKLADEKGGVIALDGVEATLTAKIERVPLWTDNVGAVLVGSGALADELVVIGAHYDHVGYGYFGSRDRNPKGKLHPGADDNASGTAGMLLVARNLAKSYADMPSGTPRRSVLFLGFSAEESGLVGSRQYVRRPIAPLDKHYVMINLDMIGRLRDDKLQMQGSYTAEGFKDWLQPYVDGSGMKVALTKGGSGPSDHATFYAKKIPILFFHTDLHREYHMPTDTADTINVEGGARVSDLIHRVALGLATREGPLPHADGTGSSGTSTTEKKEGEAPQAAADNAGAVRGTGVRFGIAPGDYTGTEPGVLIGDVFEGLPAAKAGLKVGDLITKWNGQDVRDVESWMPLLQSHKAGDKVTITFKRGNEELTTEATLVARARGGQ